MSDRPLIKANTQDPLVDEASMATSITSPPTNINRLPGLAYQVVWTGSPVGTFTVQVSNDYVEGPQREVLNAGNWDDLPTSSFSGTYPVPAGSPGHGMLDIVGTEVAWIRLVYNSTSGTGNLTVIPSAKVW